MSSLDFDFLIPLLRKSIDGGCHTPTLKPTYTKHHLIAMPRRLTEDELVYLQVALDLLPCQATLVENFKGDGHVLKVYEYYQGQ